MRNTGPDDLWVEAFVLRADGTTRTLQGDAGRHRLAGGGNGGGARGGLPRRLHSRGHRNDRALRQLPAGALPDRRCAGVAGGWPTNDAWVGHTVMVVDPDRYLGWGSHGWATSDNPDARAHGGGALLLRP
ncbi:MAG: hypothetical protein AAGA48_02935 [Myxococcota bacterium]